MQTLKTAIVVLLMMTVIFGGYVTLTTSPEPLPDAVASLIQESGSFELEIDDGLPESLPDLANTDPQGSAPLTAASQPPELAFAAPPFPDQVAATPVIGLSAPPIPKSAEMTAVTGSLSDQSMTLSPAKPLTPATNGLEELQLPKSNSMVSLPAIDPSQDYPATGSSELSLPDPQSLAPLPNSGWKKDATPVSFDMAAKNDAVTKPREPNLGLANGIRTADRQFAADQHLDALATLSLFYNSPEMSSEDRAALLSRLDPLAGSVIYSRKHLLEQPHRVGANETLMEIAARYELPWQLLANINGIDDPVSVLPGTELKVLRGPFRAEVDLQRNELTIFLRDLYAGRFPITVGTEPAPEAGTFTIQDKQSARTFYDRNGSPVPPGDSRNPYGSVWIDLGKQLCIHGSPDRGSATNQGCISLRASDAEDLYGILSQGSSVTIRR